MRAHAMIRTRFFGVGIFFMSVALVTFVACSSDDTSTGAEPDASSPEDATTDTSAPADAAHDAAIADAGSEAAPTVCETATCGTANCGTCPDAAAVGLHDDFQDKDFAVDGFEITNAAYAAFVAVNVDPKSQQSFCSFNDSFTPTAQWPAAAGNENHPVEYVDWCDAYAYCAWAGRALCANIDGTPNDPGELDNGDQSAWFRACTGAKTGTGGGGWLAYPYGDTYGPATCNGADISDGGSRAVGSLTSCEGGLPGLYDMSGNVSEWEDACNDLDVGDGGADAAAHSTCLVRGGSFKSSDAGLGCAAEALLPRATNAAGIGFRCCSR